MASSCHVCMPSTLRSSRAARHSCISTCETTLKVCKGSSATHDLVALRTIARERSFTRAAEQLDISTAMASKHVSHLENSIKAKLLHRNSRNLHLTEAGEEYYRQCSYALDTLDTAAQKAAGGADTPQGMLRVTMPLWFAGNLIGNWLAEYRERYPEVTLDLVLDNRHVDLIAEGFDLARRTVAKYRESLDIPPAHKRKLTE